MNCIEKGGEGQGLQAVSSSPLWDDALDKSE